MASVPMIEVWRGGLREGVHRGHAVIFGPGGLEQVWGDPDAVIFPRSSCKMIQALPLVESGVADRAGLTDAHLALACASHTGGAVHTDMVRDWLGTLGMGDDDLRCGAQWPSDLPARDGLIRDGASPCQMHNNCSGKHTGFLMLTQAMGAGPEYTEVDHPLQRAIRAATEEVTGQAVAGYGIDGCSAPNFAVTVTGLARAMAAFAAATGSGDTRDRAMARLRDAMRTHPVLVGGEGDPCTDQKRGVARKIEDCGARGRDAAMTALRLRLGALEGGHPVVGRLLTGPQRNWRGLAAAELRLAAEFA